MRYNRVRKFTEWTVVLYVVLFVALVVGWIMNLFKVLQISAPMSEWGVMEILRIVGVFVAPVGGVLGYL